MITAGVILLVIIFIIVGVIAGVVLFIRSKLRSVSQELFGTDSFREGLDRVSDDVAATPKSVSSMTKLMEPQIMRDFPEFVWNEFRTKAENMLKAALTAIDTENLNHLPKDISPDLKQQIINTIENNKASGVKEHYDSIHIHQTEIANYMKTNGKCVIRIQSALQCFHYKEKDGKIIHGDNERLTQTKFNTDLVYIQDYEKLGDGTSFGVTCPNCGAPIKKLGGKYCEYCGLGVTPINIRVWSLHNFAEVDYNHV